MGQEKHLTLLMTPLNRSPLSTQSDGMPNLFKDAYVVQPTHHKRDLKGLKMHSDGF